MSGADESEASAPAAQRRVWDVPTRLFHWLLVISIAASWATAELVDDAMQLHMWLGYWTVGLIAFRILWGFMGSKHARFFSFLKGPRTTLAYAGSLLGRHHETPGHNPMGGWMVVLMILLVAVQAGTGLFADDDIVWAGPWSHTVSNRMQTLLTNWHRFNTNLIIAAIGIHILAIVTYRFAMREDLIGPMITGRKSAGRVTAADAISGTPWLRAILALALAGAFAYAVVALAPPAPIDDFGDF